MAPSRLIPLYVDQPARRSPAWRALVTTLAVWCSLFVGEAPAEAGHPAELRVGSESNFRPYAYVDEDGQPAGFDVDLIKAVGKTMGLRLRFSIGAWDDVWNDLITGQSDVLPTVAQTPGRAALVDFSLPHTETYDAFFRRKGEPVWLTLAAAADQEIVVVRSDAAHHQLLERHFTGKLIVVDTIPDGLRLIAAGNHDSLLCSKLVGALEREKAGIETVVPGPPIPDYKRAFSFAVRKGNRELLEQLNQGLRIVQSNGEYDRIYKLWLGAEKGPQAAQPAYLWRGVVILLLVVLLVLAWRISREAAKWDDLLLRALTPQRFRLMPAVWRYGLALVAVAAATALRSALTPWLGLTAPYNINYLAVTCITVLLGFGPGVLAVMLGNVAVEVFVLETSTATLDAVTLHRFGASVVITSLIAIIAHAMRVAAFKARESGARLASFAAATFEGIIESEDGRIMDCNEQFARMSGYAVAELMGTEIAKLIAPEDRERVMANIQANREAAIEHAVVRKDGQRIVVEVHGRPAVPGSNRRHTAIRDITARKRTEERIAALNHDLELRVAELETIFNTSPIGLAIADDPQGVHIRGNPAYERLVGAGAGGELSLCGPRRAVYRAIRDGEEVPVDSLPMQRACRGETVTGDIMDVQRPDGKTLTLYCSAAPLLDEHGKPRGAVGAFMDLTALRVAEAAQRESEANLGMALDAAEMGTWHWDIRTGDVVWSRQCKLLYGLPLDTAMTYERFLQCVHPDDREKVAIALKEAVERQGEYQLEKRIVCPDGSVRWTASRGRCYSDETGQPARLAGVTRDITARKAAEDALRVSEQKMRSVFECAPIDIAILGLDGKFKELNPAALKLHAFTSKEELLGQDCLSMVDQASHKTVAEKWAEVLKTGIVQDVELIQLTKGGQKIYTLLSATRLDDAAGKPEAVLAMVQDITQRKKAEEKLLAKNAELTEFNRLMVDRELRMIQLKKEINQLCEHAGQGSRYAVDWDGAV